MRGWGTQSSSSSLTSGGKSDSDSELLDLDSRCGDVWEEGPGVGWSCVLVLEDDGVGPLSDCSLFSAGQSSRCNKDATCDSVVTVLKDFPGETGTLVHLRLLAVLVPVPLGEYLNCVKYSRTAADTFSVSGVVWEQGNFFSIASRSRGAMPHALKPEIRF